MRSILDAVRERRSYYAIGSESPVSNARVRELVEAALEKNPSAFHMQSSRVLLLFGEDHRKLWRIAEEVLQPQVPPERFSGTQDRLWAMAAGRGTVLFFDDTEVTEQFSKEYPLYAARFTGWADEAGAMLQFAVWTLLEADGLGASLQHYDPLIDDRVRATWALPQSWRLLGEMPFGQPYAAPEKKVRIPLDTQIRVYGCDDRRPIRPYV